MSRSTPRIVEDKKGFFCYPSDMPISVGFWPKTHSPPYGETLGESLPESCQTKLFRLSKIAPEMNGCVL